MNRTDELAGCPFCGGADINVDDAARCAECGASGPSQDDASDHPLNAIRRWNTRATQPDAALRECQAVWRCAIGDATGALDILKNRWVGSRRKGEREAGAVLAGVLDLVWAARGPAPSSYSEAAANGKALIARVRAALDTGAGRGEA